MRALYVAGKNLRELSREKMLLALVLMLPAVFLVINYASYNTPYQATHTLLVRASGSPDSAALHAVLEGVRYDDGRPWFKLVKLDPGEDATARLVGKQAVGLVEVDGKGNGHPTVSLYGDGSDMAFTKASLLVDRAVARYAVVVSQAAPARVDPVAARPVVSIVTMPLGRGAPRSLFEAYTPGMILFSILFLIPQTALLAGRESRLRTLHRLRLTRMNALDYLGGLTLSQLVVAALQLVFMLCLSAAFGFRSQGSLPLALLIFGVAAFSSIGFGMLVACFIRDDSQATNIGAAFTMVQVMLSGIFFPMPAPTLATVAGHQIGLFDFLPATHAVMAAQQVMCFGATLSQVGFRLLVLTALSVALFVAGVATFERLKMRVHGA